MDALTVSAQVWVPWLGVACVLAVGGWLECLGIPDRSSAPHPAAGYFLSFALAAVLPAFAVLGARVLFGGAATLGPIDLLTASASGDQFRIGVWLFTPIAGYLIARFLLGSLDAVSFSVAIAAAIMTAPLFAPPVVLAVALASGGLAGFAERLLGRAATGLAGATAFVFIAAFAWAGGGPAIPLLVISYIGGLMLALIASRGLGARLPLFAVIALLPSLALAWFGAGSTFDLAAPMPNAGANTYGVLVLMLAVFPAIAAAASLPPFYAARLSWKLHLLEPLAIILMLALGVVCSGIVVIAMAAVVALFSRLHIGGSDLVFQDAIAGRLSSPFSAWIVPYLCLPLAPAGAALIALATRLFAQFLLATGIAAVLDDAISNSGISDRTLLIALKRALQLAPATALCAFIIWSAPFAYTTLQAPIASGFDLLRGLSEGASEAVLTLPGT